jgi:hypothetical protein
MQTISPTTFIGKFEYLRLLLLSAAVIPILCGCQCPHSQKCDPAPPNLVSWWSGENNALDNCGLNNGKPVHSPSYAPGKVGTAFLFNGYNQCILIPDSPSLHFTNALTAEAWIYPTRPSAANSIVVKFDGTFGVNESSFSFSLYYSKLYLNLSADGTPTPSTQLNSNDDVPLNAWTHVAATYDGSTISLYINGILDATLPYSGGIYPGTDNMAIGANVGGMGSGGMAGPFAGMIDEVSLYNRALSPPEIKAIYSAGTRGKCPIPPR